MTANPETAGDERRALVFIQHHLAADVDGINTVLRQALDRGRLGPFVVTVLDAFEQLVPLLLTGPGREAMMEHLGAFAEGTVPAPTVVPNLSEEDLRRAARLIMAHGRHDGVEMDEILFDRPSITPLLVGVAVLYCATVPVLRTSVAAQLLDAAILRAAGEEAAE